MQGPQGPPGTIDPNLLNDLARLSVNNWFSGDNMFQGQQTVHGGLGVTKFYVPLTGYTTAFEVHNESEGAAIRAVGTTAGISVETTESNAGFAVNAYINSPTGNSVIASNGADGTEGVPPPTSIRASAMRWGGGPGTPTVNSVGVHSDATGFNSVAFRGWGGGGQGAAGEFNNSNGGALIRGHGQGWDLTDPNRWGGFQINADGSARFSGSVTALNVLPQGADFAESMDVAGSKADYEPGDLMAIDASGDRRLVKATAEYSTSVAGIHATKPGVLASPFAAGDPRLADDVPLAMVGIVPCKVTAANGAIARGDLLVASSLPGHAMKGTDRARMLGAVVGKALQPLPSGTGVILVLVTLQ